MSVRGSSWVEQHVRELHELVWSFKRSRGDRHAPRGRVLVITGAGCSASAGIPTAREMAKSCVIQLSIQHELAENPIDLGPTPDAQAAMAVEKLVGQGALPETFATSDPPWSVIYDYLFTKIYKSPAEQKLVIEDALADHKLNWAHACLGELMRHRFVHTVLTVNFDLLALEGAVRAGVIPAVADGFEGLSRVDGLPTYPQLVYLHGTRHNYRLRNAAHHVSASACNAAAIRAVADLVRASACILVVGYSASDNGLARLLLDSLREFANTLVWTAFDPLEEQLSPQAREICSSAGAMRLFGVDADSLFRELLRGLGLGAPEWIKDPLKPLSEAADQLVHGEDPFVKIMVEALLHRVSAHRGAMKVDADPIAAGLILAVEQDLAGKDIAAIARLRELCDSYPASLPVHRALGKKLLDIGRTRADPSLLREAVTVLQKCLDLSSPAVEDGSWEQTQTMLGRALVALGNQEDGSARLEAAVAAFRSALGAHVRQKRLLGSAAAQSDLGTALSALGHRVGQAKYLEEAVELFRKALEVRTREGHALDWATTQHDLGMALAFLGELEEGTAHLEQAVKAFGAALEVRTPDEVPMGWARTQHYMGAALRSLGTRREDMALLHQALKACHATLEKRTRDHVPAHWARSQDNLGRTLFALGLREAGSSRLEGAVAAYRAALEERQPPTLDWAITQCNLGDALSALADRKEGPARQEALAVFRTVLATVSPESAIHARAQAALARLLREHEEE